LLDDHREAKPDRSGRSQRLRVGTGQGVGDRQPRRGQGADRAPVVAPAADGWRRVRGRNPAVDRHLERREHAVRAPVANPRERRVRERVEQVDPVLLQRRPGACSGHQRRGVDDLRLRAELAGGGG
jgi:hypothetical protein